MINVTEAKCQKQKGTIRASPGSQGMRLLEGEKKESTSKSRGRQVCYCRVSWVVDFNCLGIALGAHVAM